jgi:hypothetical protein
MHNQPAEWEECSKGDFRCYFNELVAEQAPHHCGSQGMSVINHPALEAHRLACLELLQLMDADWHAVPTLRALRSAIDPWNARQVDAAIQALYRQKYAAHFRKLTGRKRTQDCPEDYLRGFRAIARAQMLPSVVLEKRRRKRALPRYSVRPEPSSGRHRGAGSPALVVSRRSRGA